MTCSEFIIQYIDSTTIQYYSINMTNTTNAAAVRMTASLAAEMLRTAAKIGPRQLTEQHLDVLQMSDIDLRTRLHELPAASDELRAGHRGPAVVWCTAAYNMLVTRSAR